MRTLVVVVAALSFSSVVWTPPARACGGMFCSSTSPTPIDQSAEKILFEVNDDGSVTGSSPSGSSPWSSPQQQPDQATAKIPQPRARPS